METTLLNHLTEKYGEICDSEFFYKSGHEKNAQVIRLIMKILTMEHEAVFDEIQKENSDKSTCSMVL